MGEHHERDLAFAWRYQILLVEEVEHQILLVEEDGTHCTVAAGDEVYVAAGTLLEVEDVVGDRWGQRIWQG